MIQSHRDLVKSAELVLRQAGFATSPVHRTDDGVDVLLAENELFALGIAGTQNLAELPFLESSAGEFLRLQLRNATLGAKRWDAYLVLLVIERGGQSMPTEREAFEIRQDIRDFRRIVATGVTPGVQSIERALRPFLPLPSGPSISQGVDALAQLEGELLEAGQPPQLVRRLVAAYRQSGSLANV